MPKIGKKAVLKMHLTLNDCVSIRFKMLTYSRVRSAFKPNRRLAIIRDLHLQDGL